MQTVLPIIHIVGRGNWQLRRDYRVRDSMGAYQAPRYVRSWYGIYQGLVLQYSSLLITLDAEVSRDPLTFAIHWT